MKSCNGILEFRFYHHFLIEVPKDSKQHIINELRLLNVTRETLFPGLDESAKAIADRYREDLGASAPQGELQGKLPSQV